MNTKNKKGTKRESLLRTVLVAVTAVGLLVLILANLPGTPTGRAGDGGASRSARSEAPGGGVERVGGPAAEAGPAARTRSPGPQRDGLDARLSAVGWNCRAERIARSSAEGAVTLTRSDGTILVADEVQVLSSGEVVGFGLLEIKAKSLQMEFSSLSEGTEKEEGFRIDGNGKILARHSKLRQMLALRPGEDRPF